MTTRPAIRFRRARRGSAWLAIAAAAIMAVLALSVTPASAQPPLVERFAESNLDSPDLFVDQCGDGIDLIGQFTVDIVDITYFDSTGEPVLLRSIVRFDGELTRSDNGNSLLDRYRLAVEVDFVTGEVTVSGLDAAITYPGDGIVYQTAGRRIEVLETGEILFSAGPDDYLDGIQKFDQVCETLA